MSAANHATIVFWFSKDGWRWRLLARNGRLVAESGEAYTRKFDVNRAWHRVMRTVLWDNVKEDWR